MTHLKSKAKILVCDRYVSKDSNGNLEYKRYLKHAIDKRYVSKDDALFIVLDLMYSINNYGLTHRDVDGELEKLVLKVKRCNDNQQTFLKKSIFYNDYSEEEKILKEYVENLQTQNSMTFNSQRSISNLKSSKNTLKQIKSNLNHLSKKDLCYILDKDPELTFEKEKSLKNEIATEFSKYPVDIRKLINSSKEDIKDYLNELIEIARENKPNELTLQIRKRMEEDAKKRKEMGKLRIQKSKDQFKKNVKLQKDKIHKKKTLTSENSVNYKDDTQKSGHIFEKIEFYDKDYIFQEYEKVKDKISEEDFVNEIYRIKRENPDNPFIDFICVKMVVEEYKNKKFSPARKVISAEDYQLFREYKLKKRYEKFKNNLSEEEFLKELKKLEKHDDDLNNFFKHINEGYLSYSIRKNLICNFKGLYTWASKIYYYPNFKSHVTDKLECLIKFIEYYEDLKEYVNLSNTSEVNQIKRINKVYIDNEIKNNETIFKDIEDENKKIAIICDEDNVKVVAGAGAGKTFIIQKKIDYLIEKFGNEKKILCLCYTGKGANDLKEKINNDNIDIFTFHGFCREVSQKCGKNIPTDDKLLDDVINNYMRKVIDDDEKLGEILEYFNYYVKNPSERQFDSIGEYEEFKRGNRLKTLRNKYDFYNGYQKQSYNGEVVRSLEELIIANFLFMHDVNYIYEDTYRHECLTPIICPFLASYNYFCLNRDLSKDLRNLKKLNELEKSWDRYQPDFYLPDEKIYIEHFGVARDNVAHWLKGDAQKKYTEDMYSKLKLHKLYNTNLITTFSYYMSEGILLDKLRESLSDYFELHERDKKEIFKIIINNNRSEDFKHFKQLIKSFINIFEAKNLPKSKLIDFKEENRSQKNVYLKRKHELFLNIVSEIYEDYDLWNQVGGLYYNREVTNALSLIESGKFKESYDYIFIDEYQDINYVRCKLLQELQKINDSKLFVVGDDWQSIYGFNGSEVKLFVDFDEYFPNSETIKISENRRNCQTLIDISSNFIRKNENQEYKELKYYKDNSSNSNPIKLVPYDKKKNKILYVEKIIREMIRQNSKKNLEILLLGRNNKDINFLINNRLFKQVYDDKKSKRIEYSKNSNVTIDFMSIHQSKGLEKDEVIVLNFEDYDYGFPNRVDDDSVLHFIKEKEDYLFAEERRLLYVALTRTRHNVYLIYPNLYHSVFIEELKDDYGLEDSIYRINLNDLIGLNEFNDFYCGNNYKYWYYNSIPIPIDGVDYYFKINDEGYLNEIELELYIWYEYMLKYDDPLENAFKKLIGFKDGTKNDLKKKSLEKKNVIRNSDISLLVNDKKCNFTISGIGYKSVKFTKRIIFEDDDVKKEYVENILRQYVISIEDLERLLGI